MLCAQREEMSYRSVQGRGDYLMDACFADGGRIHWLGCTVCRRGGNARGWAQHQPRRTSTFVVSRVGVDMSGALDRHVSWDSLTIGCQG